MRVIAGKYRSRNLNTPKDNSIRPTMDRAKEGIFSSLAFDIIDASVLDLFSGTGNLAIESLSREARSATFVDNDTNAITLINSNLSLVGASGRVIKSDVKSYLENTTGSFDIIFMDPPYNLDNSKIYELLDLIVKKKILNSDGKLILEFDKNKKLDVSNYNVLKVKKYGISNFYIIGAI